VDVHGPAILSGPYRAGELCHPNAPSRRAPPSNALRIDSLGAQRRPTRARVVARVTIVRRESDVGLPKGPSVSASVIRPAHVHVVLTNYPGNDSPSDAEPEHDIALDVRGVVQPVRQLKLQRTPRLHTHHHRIDAWQRIALADAPQTAPQTRAALWSDRCPTRLYNRPHRHDFRWRVGPDRHFQPPPVARRDAARGPRPWRFSSHRIPGRTIRSSSGARVNVIADHIRFRVRRN
jgi:hypothetical protein